MYKGPEQYLDNDAAATGHEALGTDRPQPIRDFVIGGRKGAVGRDGHLIANFDTVPGVQHAARVDHCPLTNSQIATSARRLDLHKTVDDGVRSNDDARPANGILDVGQARDLGLGMDFDHVEDKIT